jgi:hypothetical protein
MRERPHGLLYVYTCPPSHSGGTPLIALRHCVCVGVLSLSSYPLSASTTPTYRETCPARRDER